MNKKIIIGLTGEMGSGKDTFCNLVKENYENVFVFRFSDPLTEILKMFFDDVKREDQQWLGPLLKQKFGADVLLKALIRKAKNIKQGIIIFNGIRAEGEAKSVKEIQGKIIYITAESKKRWERVCKRKEKADDDVSYENFLKMHEAETEIPIPKIGEQAEVKIENNGTKQDFYNKIKKVLA